MIEQARKLANDAAARAAKIVRRGLLRVASAAGFAQVEGAADGETFDNVELWQGFGLASRPPAGSEALVVLVDGNEDQPILISGTSRDDRPATLNSGDAVLYGTKSGSDQATVTCRADGSVELGCGSGEFVEVGGNAESILLGDTVKADIITFATGLTTVNLAARAGALVTAAASWSSSKGKVT